MNMYNVKVRLPKEELESKTREELQEKLNKFIEAGFLPPDTTTDDIEPELNYGEIKLTN